MQTTHLRNALWSIVLCTCAATSCCNLGIKTFKPASPLACLIADTLEVDSHFGVWPLCFYGLALRAPPWRSQRPRHVRLPFARRASRGDPAVVQCRRLNGGARLVIGTASCNAFKLMGIDSSVGAWPRCYVFVLLVGVLRWSLFPCVGPICVFKYDWRSARY